jgi:phage terminase Nu1 subunit (DNA packaging protein)
MDAPNDAEARGALVNRVQMAAILGIAKTTLDEWVRRGCPVHKPARAKGSPAEFDIAKVVRWRLADAMRRAWDPHSRPLPLG